MVSAKGSQNLRSLMYPGKSALLPPKIPFPSVSASCIEYVPSGLTGSKIFQKPREGTGQHQRASSGSLILDEQPFWLDDLLNEPESPIRRNGHRRSSSDSFACLDAANAVSIDYSLHNGYRFGNTVSLISGGIQDKDARATSFYSGASVLSQKNKPWDPFVVTGSQHSYLPSAGKNFSRRNSGPTYMSLEAEKLLPLTGETKNHREPVPQNQTDLSYEKRESSSAKSDMCDTDSSKRAKQQFALRSRVCKLQYIAELERNVQALEAEGSEVSAQLEYLNQQNLVLGMENKALKQRLESLAQEKLIKHLEQEILEREIGRLRVLYKQQQQKQREEQQQEAQISSSTHRHASSKDLESQFANLSLKHKYSSSSHIPTTG